MRMKSTSRPGQNSSMIFFQLLGSMPYFSMPLYRLSQSWSFHFAFSVAYTTRLGLKKVWFSDPSGFRASARVTARRVAFAHATRGSTAEGVAEGEAVIASAIVTSAGEVGGGAGVGSEYSNQLALRRAVKSSSSSRAARSRAERGG